MAFVFFLFFVASYDPLYNHTLFWLSGGIVLVDATGITEPICFEKKFFTPRPVHTRKAGHVPTVNCLALL